MRVTPPTSLASLIPLIQRIGAWLALALLLPGIAGCAFSLPWRSVDQRAVPPPGQTVIVVVTQGRIRDGQRSAFDAYNRAVLASMTTHPGLLGYSVRRELLGPGVWTVTAWRDELALTDFTMSPDHQTAQDSGRATLATMRSVRLNLPAESVPVRWADALRWLDMAPASR